MSTEHAQLQGKNKAAAANSERWLDQVSRRTVLAAMDNLRLGAITLRENGKVLKSVSGNDIGLSATIEVLNPGFYLRILQGGLTGAGESYMDGDWRTNDLACLVRIMVRNWHVSEKMNGGVATLAGLANRFIHLFRGNTVRGSKKNISAHYDLSNDFFKTFLDETMMYSCAYFDRPEQSLFDASRAKLDRICRKLNLTPNDHVIEIGTGWGGFALYAAQHYGCRVTTTTISEEQYALAKERIARAGLETRITLLKEDYRDLQGKYDKLVSIEMLEAVGWQYFDAYFEKCATLLKRDGLMCIQTITMADQDYETSKDSVDFIKKHIFPGGCLPSATCICASVTKKTDLRLVDFDDITPHYAKTLRMWRENVYKSREQIHVLGFDERFMRMWEYYLAYCEGGFEEQCIGACQLVFKKPDARTGFARYGDAPTLLGNNY